MAGLSFHTGKDFAQADDSHPVAAELDRELGVHDLKLVKICERSLLGSCCRCLAYFKRNVGATQEVLLPSSKTSHTSRPEGTRRKKLVVTQGVSAAEVLVDF